MEPQQNNESAQNGTPQATPVSQESAQVKPAEVNNTTLMAILAYIGVLVLIPFFVAKEDPFVKFHVKQGLVLFAIELVLWVLSVVMYNYFLSSLIGLCNLGLLVLSIIGIINVIQKKEVNLPLVGVYADKFRV